MQELELSDFRRFVLGDLEEETRRRIEADALANDEIFDEIEAVEDAIIEEFVSGTLPASERKLFEESLDRVPGRSRRIAMVRELIARRPVDDAAVVHLKDHARQTNHARFAIAAGFAAAAITAVAFFQVRSATTAPAPAPSASSMPANEPSAPAMVPLPQSPETSSAIAVHRPGAASTASLDTPVAAKPVVPVVTFLLAATTARSDDASSVLEIRRDEKLVDVQIAIDDDEFSHYNAEIRGADGSTISTHRDVPVTALRGAPVVRLEVPAELLQAGRYELVLAGIHERGSEEVAYLEFDVRR